MLERSSGAPTYFAADVAYHEDKVLRGFDRLIDVLGADHHGYIGRLKAAMAALGNDPDRLEIAILQFVHIVEGGGRTKMSKRRGDFVTLDELIERIGVDATRWYMISRSHETTIDLDLELAAKQDPENPVYYVQYAHARIASILRNLAPAAARGGARRRRRRPRAQRFRARADPPPARLPERGPRGGRAARPAPDRQLRARVRAGVRRLLPRLAGTQGVRRRVAGLPHRAVRRVPAHARQLARPAGGLGAGGNVMLDATTSISVPARLPAPYVHADNRGMVLCNGPRCVCIPGSQLRTFAETFTLIADEGRATRSQGDHVVGGYVVGDDVDRCTPGTQDDLVSVTLTAADFNALRKAIERGRDEDCCSATVAALLVLAAPAQAGSKLLTFYSPPIDSEPYVHKSTTVMLKADGRQAPAEPGYVLGFQEQALVDSKDPDAKPLPVAKMMVHHFLYYTSGRVDDSDPPGCLGGSS